MENLKDFERQFFFEERKNPKIHFGLYSKDGGGTIGEMCIDWGFSNIPELRVFNDGWMALASFSDLILKMAEYDDKNIAPKEFAKILKLCKFKDITEEL